MSNAHPNDNLRVDTVFSVSFRDQRITCSVLHI